MNSSPQTLRDPFRIILDSITDGVFTVDSDFKIQSFNRAAEQITGISREEAMGRSCFEVFRANVCEQGCVLRRTMESGEPLVNMPVYIVRADKKQIPISVSTALLKDNQGRIVGGVETFRDLSVETRLRKTLQKEHSFDDIVSRNLEIHRIFSILPQISQSTSTVLIEGASGTGKELLARVIHRHSGQKEGPFVAVNCGALPETLIESELFGYKAGAFTDAKKDYPGRFAAAQNGSLFLDEIGDIPKAVQIRLLRVLDRRTYEPLGSTTVIQTNARVIAATNQDLERLVEGGKFRDDLYYRINIIKLALPPLSERKEDIPLLVDHFIEKYNCITGKSIAGITQEAIAALSLHEWPGNIRELENALEHAFVLCRGEWIGIEHLPKRFTPGPDSADFSFGLTLLETEKKAILQALERNDWKKVTTAQELGIDKNTLRRKIIRHGIKP